MKERLQSRVIPALEFHLHADDGWSELSHRIWPSRGFFCWRDAPLYIEFESEEEEEEYPNKSKARYEKIVFQAFSFVEKFDQGIPSFGIIEEHILERKEITEKEYRASKITACSEDDKLVI